MIPPAEITKLEKEAIEFVRSEYEKAILAEDPKPEDLYEHIYAPTSITEEKGTVRRKETSNCNGRLRLFAIRELMAKHPECLLYGQDVGARLGGVFREAATLAQQFGDHRVFNTPIQEAFIIGSTVGMSVAGLKQL